MKEKVIVLQNNQEQAKIVANGLIERFNVLLSTDDYKQALDVAINSDAKFFITALMLKQTDGIEVIQNLKQKCSQIHCLVLSVADSGELISEAMRAGAEYCMVKPINFQILLKRMNAILTRESQAQFFEYRNSEGINLKSTNDKKQISCNKEGLEEKEIGRNKVKEYRDFDADTERIRFLNEEISKIFMLIGIPPHIKGYGYLKEAVKLAVIMPEIMNSVTKKLYPMIAEKYLTTPSKVERAIRHAIEVAWNKSRIDAFNSLFGVRVFNENEKPTNSEFIALIAEKLILEEMSNVNKRNLG